MSRTEGVPRPCLSRVRRATYVVIKFQVRLLRKYDGSSQTGRLSTSFQCFRFLHVSSGVEPAFGGKTNNNTNSWRRGRRGAAGGAGAAPRGAAGAGGAGGPTGGGA